MCFSKVERPPLRPSLLRSIFCCSSCTQSHVDLFVYTGKLTEPVGRALAGLPVEPWMGKVLLAGAQLGCAQEALIIVAMAATDSVWISPRYQYDTALHTTVSLTAAKTAAYHQRVCCCSRA